MIYQQSQKFEYHINASSIEAAVEGLGITRLLSYHIASQLSDGSLKVILREFKSKTVPVYIMHNAGRFTSAKNRTFVDLMAERLRDDASLN